ncbi:RNA 2',3'-cyclic phosphodiesterase [Haloarchaeobius amylolyticus]|uniref:RNA 2',3'-cyclic phosphodiesterase n=1 Tax=Haloarchaeobius amylolyticus TaxID=1198296 RepID=UPI002271B2AB|nr:RNA 2',3'-cyclic phosphodiesterase [Haloarchaeobius amylolyticus]
MRLFVSIDLPDDIAEDVEALQDCFEEATGLKFVDPTQAHVTLKFLGEVSKARLPAVEEAVEAGVRDAEVPPFEATFGGLGVFPSLDYINVLWLGVRDGADEMTTLHEGIEAETTAIGFSPESHEFTPHVTLARMEHAGGKETVQACVRDNDPEAGSMQVEEVRLTESVLTPDGPEYRTVERFRL